MSRKRNDIKGDEMKNSIFLCSHGNFAKECVRSAKMIMGEVEGIHTFSLMENQTIEDYIQTIEEAIKQSDAPILILVDLFGGTPFNACFMLSKKYNIKIVTGFNLGMFIELAIQKENYEMDELAEMGIKILKESGKIITGKEI